MIDAVLLLLTLALGAALARVSLCAVGGMQQAVVARNYQGLERLLLAASGAGVVLLLFAGLAPGHVGLPAASRFHTGIIVGGALLGLGALLNGGCYLGSVLYLGSGNLNFLLTLVGIGLGARSAEALAPLRVAAVPAVRMALRFDWMAGAGLFALLIVLLLRGRSSRERWLALCAGMLGGVVCARHPGWSYGAVVETLAHGQAYARDRNALLSAAMLFVGALAGARLAGRFELRRPTPWRGMRCLVGGTVMGCGAALIPGGNDTLLLWAIPGLAVNGALAYIVMLTTIGLGVALGARLQRAPGAASPGPPQ